MIASCDFYLQLNLTFSNVQSPFNFNHNSNQLHHIVVVLSGVVFLLLSLSLNITVSIPTLPEGKPVWLDCRRSVFVIRFGLLSCRDVAGHWGCG